MEREGRIIEGNQSEIFSFFLSVGNIYSPFTSFSFFFPFFVFRLFFSHPFFPVISFSSFLARQPTPGVTEPEFTPAPIRTVPHAFSFAAKLWQRFPILITFLTSSRLLASFTNLAVLPAGRPGNGLLSPYLTCALFDFWHPKVVKLRWQPFL